MAKERNTIYCTTVCIKNVKDSTKNNYIQEYHII